MYPVDEQKTKVRIKKVNETSLRTEAFAFILKKEKGKRRKINEIKALVLNGKNIPSITFGSHFDKTNTRKV